MELVASFLGSAAVEVGRFVCSSVYLTIRKTVKLQSNIDALDKEITKLVNVRNHVKLDLESAVEDGNPPTSKVEEWFKEVEEIVLKVNSMQVDMISNKKKFSGCFFNCSQRYRLSGEAEKMVKEVERLIKLGSFPAGLVDVMNRDKRVEHFPGPSIFDQTTASKTLAETMSLLNNDSVRRIGIWGMGGVGKTTLVKNLNNKLKSTLSTQSLGIVIWATVSKDLNMKKVQRQIAERLNLEVKVEESLERMAVRLYQRLEDEKYILILDDVWGTIDLDCLGIPQPEVQRGSKIILTSRSLEVCREMKTDVDIKVDVLDDEEAWQLFIQNAGDVANLNHIKPFAKAVTRECSGLPLAIITMGTAMRGKTMVKLWKHALYELRKSMPCIKGIENKVYKPIKWSYDSLEGNNIKPCFLYCSLFPEDFSIEIKELVQYWVAEGFIDEKRNCKDSLNMGIYLIEKLKDSCLLEVGSHAGTVKMHDVIRDVAIWIASSWEDGCKSLVQSGIGLNQISGLELSESYKRISFMNNEINTLPSDCMIECSDASTLLLQGNLPLKTIPNEFLQGFQALKVLNISGTRIQSMPISLVQLGNLRALLLGDCFYLEELPSMEGLGRLQILDLCATRIRELPKGTDNLINLRQFNLSRTHYLKTIRAGTVSKLSCLEALDMTLSAYHWGVNGEVEEGQTSFEDLGCLERLLVLSIRLESIPCLASEDIHWISRLKRFQLFIGPTANYLPTRHDKRRVTMSGLNLSGGGVGWLLMNATSLVLNRCWGLNRMLEDLVISSVGCFSGLKSLTISSSNSSLRPDGGCAAHFDLLPNIEELYVHGLTYLESISELVGHLGLRFSRLRLIEVSRCSQLKHLVSIGSFILTLPNLDEIKVSFCDKLEELFNYGSWDPNPVVPNLRVMELKNLPKLRSICRKNETWQCLEQLEVIKCNRVTMLPLTAQNINTIKEIRGQSQWWTRLEWDDENTKSSLEPYFKQAL